MEYKLACRKGRCVQVSFDNGLTWKSTGCYNKEEAILKLEREKHTGNGVTLNQYAKDFYIRTDPNSIRYANLKRGHKIVEATYYARQCKLDKYIIPRFGRERLTDLTSREVNDWFVSLKNGDKELTAGVRNDILCILREILDKAITDDILTQNVARNIQLAIRQAPNKPTITKNELQTLFPEDDSKLISVWGKLKYACLFCLEKDTGFRPSEVFALTWDDINFDSNSVYTRKSVSQFEKKVVERIKTTGKGKNYKVGLITQQTARLLKMYRIICKTDLLFLSRSGEVYNIADTNRLFRRRIKQYLGREDLTQYCLRHAFMTSLINKFPKEIIMELMGHTKWEDCYDDRDSEVVVSQLLDRIKKASI